MTEIVMMVLALPDECDSCKAKPGAPVLCALCLAVRELKGKVESEPGVRLIKEALAALDTHGEWLTTELGVADVSMPDALVRATRKLEQALGKR